MEVSNVLTANTTTLKVFCGVSCYLMACGVTGPILAFGGVSQHLAALFGIKRSVMPNNAKFDIVWHCILEGML